MLLHEMIHLYIAWKGIRDDAPHGRVFRRMMDELNTRYGWNITVSTSMRGRQTTAPRDSNRQRLVLALENSRGECFLSVVNPRYAVRLKAQLGRAIDVRPRVWFVSTDPFFADFTTVRSLRARRVTRTIFEEKIAGGKAIAV